jgi:hypothetical protein
MLNKSTAAEKFNAGNTSEAGGRPFASGLKLRQLLVEAVEDRRGPLQTSKGCGAP